MKKYLTNLGMQKAALILFTVLFAMSGFSQTDVQFTLTDPQFGLSNTTNRLVILQAESGNAQSGTTILLPFRLTGYTDTNGQITFSNLYGSSIAGWYHWTVPAPPQRAEGDIWVQDTNLGLVAASSILGNFGNSTYPAGSFSWSAATSDSRYGGVGAPLAGVVEGILGANTFSSTGSNVIQNIANTASNGILALAESYANSADTTNLASAQSYANSADSTNLAAAKTYANLADITNAAAIQNLIAGSNYVGTANFTGLNGITGLVSVASHALSITVGNTNLIAVAPTGAGSNMTMIVSGGSNILSADVSHTEVSVAAGVATANAENWAALSDATNLASAETWAANSDATNLANAESYANLAISTNTSSIQSAIASSNYLKSASSSPYNAGSQTNLQFSSLSTNDSITANAWQVPTAVVLQGQNGHWHIRNDGSADFQSTLTNRNYQVVNQFDLASSNYTALTAAQVFSINNAVTNHQSILYLGDGSNYGNLRFYDLASGGWECFNVIDSTWTFTNALSASQLITADGSSISKLNATALTLGTVPIARLSNVITNDSSSDVIFPGNSMDASSFNHSAILSGSGNLFTGGTDENSSWILGGNNNTNQSSGTVGIAGSENNVVGGDWNLILGNGNTVSGNYTTNTILLGSSNVLNQTKSSIVIGYSNSISDTNIIFIGRLNKGITIRPDGTIDGAFSTNFNGLQITNNIVLLSGGGVYGTSGEIIGAGGAFYNNAGSIMISGAGGYRWANSNPLATTVGELEAYNGTNFVVDAYGNGLFGNIPMTNGTLAPVLSPLTNAPASLSNAVFLADQEINQRAITNIGGLFELATGSNAPTVGQILYSTGSTNPDGLNAMYAAAAPSGGSGAYVPPTLTGLCSNYLLAYWNGDSPNGTNFYDLSGSRYQIVATNPISGTMPSFTQGIRGPAVSFPGTNSYLAGGSNSMFIGLSSLSMGAWVFATNVGGLQRAIVAQTITNILSGAASITIQPTGIFGFAGRSQPSDSVQVVNSPTGFITNSWQFIVGSMNLSKQYMLLYTNGVLCASNSVGFGVSPIANSMGGFFDVGAVGPPGSAVQFWNGYIHQPFVTSRELTAAEILALYNSGKGVMP